MDNIPPEKRAEWRERAAKKDAIVPRFFEVFPTYVILECGSCGHRFRRNLVPNVNEPTFLCPAQNCGARNWTPITFERPR